MLKMSSLHIQGEPRRRRPLKVAASARDSTPEQWMALLGFMDSRGDGRTPEVLGVFVVKGEVMLGASPEKKCRMRGG